MFVVNAQDYTARKFPVKSALLRQLNFLQRVSYGLKRGWLLVSLFINLFIGWSSRMAALLLCYHSIAPCTSKDGISAIAICHL